MTARAPTTITENEYGGFAAVVYRNEDLSITCVPELGAKVVSIIDLGANYEWLTSSDGGLRSPSSLNDTWQEYDKSGWDECFPSVAPGYYSVAPWSGTPLRDHGELWQRPWRWWQAGEGLMMSVHGLRFPYEFARGFRLNGRRLDVAYSMHNLSELPFVCMWSMHPLFVARPGARIVLPRGCTMTIDADLGDEERARYRERLEWPLLTTGRGADRDLSIIASVGGQALKLFSDAGAVTRTALCDAGSGRWLGIEVGPRTVPHFGLWLNEGKWPSAGEGLVHVALEPTSGCSDDLDISARLGSAWLVPGGARQEWHVTMVLGVGAEEAEAFVGR
jgi:galactose mutarotase-like enzyme